MVNICDENSPKCETMFCYICLILQIEFEESLIVDGEGRKLSVSAKQKIKDDH